MSQLSGLVDAGNTVVKVEHNMRLATESDWIIDIGPGAGNEGGLVVAQGVPAKVAKSRASRTAAARPGLVAHRSLVARHHDRCRCGADSRHRRLRRRPGQNRRVARQPNGSLSRPRIGGHRTHPFPPRKRRHDHRARSHRDHPRRLRAQDQRSLRRARWARAQVQPRGNQLRRGGGPRRAAGHARVVGWAPGVAEAAGRFAR